MVLLSYPSLAVVGLQPSPGWKADPWTTQTPLPLPSLCSPSSTVVSEHVAGQYCLKKEMRKEGKLPEETQTCHQQRQVGDRNSLGSV